MIESVREPRRPSRRPWLILAAVASAALVLGIGLVGLPSLEPAGPGASPSPRASLPGTPGHYVSGEMSFDYPAEWSVIAGDDHGATGVLDVLAVLGTGSWHENCQRGSQGSTSWMNCGSDVVDFGPGGVVVKIYRWWGGPAPMCRGDTQANATLGALAVRKAVIGNTTSYEIRLPGNDFGQQPNNVFVEVHTTSPAQLVRAEALVASFRWLDISFAGACASESVPTGAPSPS